jgi:hypothetical protein
VDPIHVPAPPRSAYNQNRRVSDLLLSQLKHFQHVDQKHGALGIPADLTRDIHTEGGAARYIAAVTRALRGTASPQPVAVAAVSTARPAKGRRKTERKTVRGSAVAAGTARVHAPAKKSASKKAVAKRRTARKPTRKK